MVEEKFKNLFQEFVKKIPYIEGGHLTSVNFTIIYSEDGGPAKNVLVARYVIKEKYIECLMQSPKDVILGDVDTSKLNFVKIANQKFCTNYEPGIGYFPSDYLPRTTKLYTIMNDMVITIATDEKEHLKLIRWDKSAEPKFRLLELIKKIPEKVNGFEIRFLYGGRETHRDHFTIIFTDGTEKEMKMEYYEDEKDAIELLMKDIKRRKEIKKSIIKGEVGGKPAMVYRINKNSAVILELTKGKEEDLLAAQKLTELFK